MTPSATIATWCHLPSGNAPPSKTSASCAVLVSQARHQSAIITNKPEVELTVAVYLWRLDGESAPQFWTIGAHGSMATAHIQADTES